MLVGLATGILADRFMAMSMTNDSLKDNFYFSDGHEKVQL
jgi:hypothetical protein